jgi:aminoglycoside phosphotransferase
LTRTNILCLDMTKNGIRHVKFYEKPKLLRLFTLATTKLVTQRYLKKAFAHPSGAVFFLNFCIKIGASETLAEAHALRFIAEHTSIPVPKVHHAFINRGKTYILMERIRGETISKRWHSLSDTSKALIFQQLRTMIEELRSVQCESPAVSNLEGGPIYDCRLPKTTFWGPFEPIDDFHVALRNNVTSDLLQGPIHSSVTPAILSDVKEVVVFHESVKRPPVLTHGDLSSFNILVRDDKVMGIIDWETAGWLPYYWEYTTAWQSNPRNLFWRREVINFLDPYEEELRMDKLRRMHVGEI